MEIQFTDEQMPKLKRTFKNEISIQLQNIGWSTQIDFTGETPDGEKWFADVYAKKDNAQIAVMIEWDDNEIQEYYSNEQKQKRIDHFNKLNASKVRGIWFAEYNDQIIEAERCEHSYKIPLFYFDAEEKSEKSDSDEFLDLYFNIYQYMGGDSSNWVEIDFEFFFPCLLEHKTFRWSFMKNDSLTLIPTLKERKCWKCQKPTRVITQLNYFKENEDTLFKFDQLKIDEAPQRHIDLINDINYLKHRGIGPIKLRYSKTIGGKYLSNGCHHCDALQGDFFLSHFDYQNNERIDLQDSIELTIAPNEVLYGHWIDTEELDIGKFQD